MRRIRLLTWIFYVVLGLLIPALSHASVTSTYSGYGSVSPYWSGSSAVAWRWTGDATGWKRSDRPAYQRIYVQNFASGWEWTWSAGDGWLAMHTYDVTAPSPLGGAGARLPMNYDVGFAVGAVLYVSPMGSTLGNGSLANPLPTMASAIARVGSGATATIIVRGGTYHEGRLAIASGRTIHVIAYPGEIPTFIGSQSLSGGWVAEGSLSYHAYAAQPVTDGSGISFSTGQNLTGDGVGKFPDQAWVGSQQLRQVSAKASVTTGTFYVDAASGRIYLAAADAARGSIAASDLDVFLSIYGAGSSVEGLRIERYSNSANDYGVVRVGNPGDNVVLRNLEISETVFQAVSLSGGSTAATTLKNPRLENVTISHSNWMGISSTLVDNLLVRRSRIRESNQFNEFTHSPMSGALKTSRNRGIRILESVIDSNHSNGLWFDQSNYDVDVVGNVITESAGSGVFFEISDNLLLADNYIRGAGSSAVKLAGSSGLKLINNTIIGGRDAIGIYTDSRSIAGCANPANELCSSSGSMSSDRDNARPHYATMDWRPRLDLMLNNIVMNPSGNGYCGALVALCITSKNASALNPIETILHHADPGRGIPQTRMDGNVYVNAGGSQKLVGVSLGSYATPAAFSSAMSANPVAIGGLDASSKYGFEWVSVDGFPVAALISRLGEAAAIPTDFEINAYLAAGSKRFGFSY